MLTHEAEAVQAWAALASGAALTVTLSLLVPAAIAGAAYREQRKRLVGAPGHRGPEPDYDSGHGARLEVRDWSEAGALAGCPWDFDGCEELGEALERVWRGPLLAELRAAKAALEPRVRALRVACCPTPSGPRFAAVYALAGGQELFGGAPLEHAVTLELGAPTAGEAAACLAPLHRVHDGFGVLLALEHLPALLAGAEACGGSCFYLHPRWAVAPLNGAPRLLRFARVDRHCCACLDRAAPEPRVVYVDRGGEVVEDDDEAPLAFAAETIRNVAGQASALN